MKRFVFGECVQGFSHIQKNVECQDSYKTLELEDGAIVMAVADGHGSKSCPFSKTGSEIAVNVFCKVMSNTYSGYQNNMDMLPTYLNREGSLKFAQTVDQEWKEAILDTHKAIRREIPLTEDGCEDLTAVYRMYGSTLLGLLIAPTFVFAFQVGDGDITYADNGHTEPVVRGDKLLGVESHSLCALDSWKKAVSLVRPRNWEETLPCFFMLSTDGFSNSFISDQEFEKTCAEYLGMLKEYGPAVVEANLKSWLSETSQLGCGDDITVLVAYFMKDEDARPNKTEDNSTETLLCREAAQGSNGSAPEPIETGADDESGRIIDTSIPSELPTKEKSNQEALQ